MLHVCPLSFIHFPFLLTFSSSTPLYQSVQFTPPRILLCILLSSGGVISMRRSPLIKLWKSPSLPCGSCPKDFGLLCSPLTWYMFINPNRHCCYPSLGMLVFPDCVHNTVVLVMVCFPLHSLLCLVTILIRAEMNASSFLSVLFGRSLKGNTNEEATHSLQAYFDWHSNW